MIGDARRAEAILRAACGDRVRTGFRLAPLTSFRIGGPAALYMEPESDGDLAAAAEAVREAAIPFVVLGKGSNVLISDAGFSGLVIRLGRTFRWAGREGDRLSAGGAMPLPALAGIALAHGLSGLEFGVAIPGSLGGAVRMNAGAHGGDMAGVLETIDLYSLDRVARRRIHARAVAFSYRGSDLPPTDVVLGATMSLTPAEPALIRATMGEVRDWRRRTQPLAEPSCGSVFKNPAGDHAARLVEEAGGKGLRVGGAAVSTKHANFIVTSEGVRAVDVVELIRTLQDLVAARSGVRLEPEVHLVGDFDLVPR